MSTIDLTDTGKLTASGPATFEIDQIFDDTWKITLLSGRLRVEVCEGRYVKIATNSGAEELGSGVYWISDSVPIFQEDAQAGEQEEQTVDELMDEAMKAFTPRRTELGINETMR